jgi:hypothetical protein
MGAKGECSLHHLLIKGLTYLSFGTRPGEKPLEYTLPNIGNNPLGTCQHSPVYSHTEIARTA